MKKKMSSRFLETAQKLQQEQIPKWEKILDALKERLGNIPEIHGGPDDDEVESLLSSAQYILTQFEKNITDIKTEISNWNARIDRAQYAQLDAQRDIYEEIEHEVKIYSKRFEDQYSMFQDDKNELRIDDFIRRGSDENKQFSKYKRDVNDALKYTTKLLDRANFEVDSLSKMGGPCVAENNAEFEDNEDLAML
jgi:hypothetical protein